MTILCHHYKSSELQNKSISGFWYPTHTDHKGIPICFAHNFYITHVCPTSRGKSSDAHASFWDRVNLCKIRGPRSRVAEDSGVFGMWCSITGGTVYDVLKDQSGYFWGQAVQKNCLTVKALLSLKMPVSTGPITQHHIPASHTLLTVYTILHSSHGHAQLTGNINFCC
jgi:hypothetical protein